MKDSEPYMYERYSNDDITLRPLPPIRVEIQNGCELKTISEILNRIRIPGIGGRDHHRDRDYNRDNRRNSHGNDNRHITPNHQQQYQKRYDRNDRSRGSNEFVSRNNDSSSHKRERDNSETTSNEPSRPVFAYVDVDATKVCS